MLASKKLASAIAEQHSKLVLIEDTKLEHLVEKKSCVPFRQSSTSKLFANCILKLFFAKRDVFNLNLQVDGNSVLIIETEVPTCKFDKSALDLPEDVQVNIIELWRDPFDEDLSKLFQLVKSKAPSVCFITSLTPFFLKYSPHTISRFLCKNF